MVKKYICLECHKEELIFWYNDMYCLNCKKTFKIEDLLKKCKELGSEFEVIEYGLPDPNFHPGGISHTRRVVRCPLCKSEFTQEIESGCFSITATPYSCEKCGFYPILSILKIELLKKVNNY